MKLISKYCIFRCRCSS